MSKDRELYIAAKLILLVLCATLTVCGMQSLLIGGGKATTAVCLWLSGVLGYAFATLEE